MTPEAQVRALAQDAARSNLTLSEARAAFETALIFTHIAAAGGHKGRAAQTLQIEPGHLFRRLRGLRGEDREKETPTDHAEG